MKAILRQRLGFSRQKGSPFYDLELDKGDIIEVTKLYTEKHAHWSCWCIRILYNNERYWCVYDYNTTDSVPCPIILLEN